MIKESLKCLFYNQAELGHRFLGKKIYGKICGY